MLGIFTGIISAISTFVSVVGPAARIASGIIAILPQALEVGKIVLNGICDVIVKVAQALSIMPEEEDIEEIGAKIDQPGTRGKLEDESMEDYINYLRNDVKLDRERMLSMSPEDRMKCQALGIGTVSQAINEKTGLELSPSFLVSMNKMKMTGDQLLCYINSFSSNRLDSMDYLVKYLSEKLSDEEKFKVHDAIEKAEKELSPNSSIVEIETKIDEMRDNLK